MQWPLAIITGSNVTFTFHLNTVSILKKPLIQENYVKATCMWLVLCRRWYWQKYTDI